ncbi:hypothetical protein OG806_22030 [Streptomyces sp. NBC_00882]|uniref:hypothetical protein n=1 Tax=Streptomyces sp. NBC_00882 TaxID=2975856 RepID=UPI00386F2E8B|nr:hypothetical protein OG806_22030 [Streptomyces sp. NBC_00882]
MLVRVRLALRLDGEQKAAFVVGRTDPEEAIHPTLQRPDLGEIGVERLDRAVLGEPDARLRHETGQEIRLLSEDPMDDVMWGTDHATERNRANTRPRSSQSITDWSQANITAIQSARHDFDERAARLAEDAVDPVRPTAERFTRSG